MSKTFLRLLIVNAALQFFLTRIRAGRAEEEGAAEAMWIRYPITVAINALIWTLMFSTLGRIIRPMRSRRD
ncbi:MAG: hypothetical protein WEB52_06570 [Dehalococcoidia bacterium]